MSYCTRLSSSCQPLPQYLPLSEFTATNVLALLLTVDGLESGLDADLLDGLSSAAFALASHVHAGEDITSGTIADARIASTITRDSEVMTIVLANDGSGSGLDADLLDGLSSAAFESAGAVVAHAALTTTHGVTGNIVGTGGVQTLASKTLTLPTIGDFTNAQHNHSNAAGGGTVSGGGGTPGGADTYVQFNDVGVLGGVAGFAFAKATNVLSVTGRVVTPKWSPSADSATALQVTKADGSTAIVNVDTTNSRVGIGTTVSSPGHGLSVRHSDNLLTAFFQNPTPTTGKTQVIIRNGAGNSTGGSAENCFQIHNNTGTATAGIRGDGYIQGNIIGTIDDSTVVLSQQVSAFSIPGVNFDSTAMMSWSSSTDWWGSKDLALARNGAGIVEINSGVAGTLRDLRARNARLDSLRLDITPTAETPSATHTAIINFNGANYKVLCVPA